MPSRSNSPRFAAELAWWAPRRRSPFKVIETAKKVLHTGQIGDGKVFVYDIENVVKIRTGEEGYLALQDTHEE